MRPLLIDNYDSFTYNLADLFWKVSGTYPETHRSNKINVSMVKRINPTHIIISPGPGHPSEALEVKSIVKNFCEHTPILGVCLGHQIIAHVFGSKVKKLENPQHGITNKISHNNKGIFRGLPNPLTVAVYNSLSTEVSDLSTEIELTSWYQNQVMAITLKRFPRVFGVQFHPESFMSSHGDTLISNFLKLTS
mgnify:CR=1 FL=1